MDFQCQKYRRLQSAHLLFEQKVFRSANRENVDARRYAHIVPAVFRGANQQYEVLLSCSNFGKQFSNLQKNLLIFYQHSYTAKQQINTIPNQQITFLVVISNIPLKIEVFLKRIPE